MRDIFNLGLITYFMYTGEQLSFDGQIDREDIEKELDLLFSQKKISESARNFIKACI